MDQYPSHYPAQSGGHGGMSGGMPGGLGGLPGGMNPGMPGGRPGMGSPGNQAPDVAGAVKGKGKGKKGDKKVKPPTSQSSKRLRIAALVAAVVGVSAYGLITFGNDPVTYVVTARTSVGALQQVAPSQLEAVAINPEFVEDGAVTAETAQEALDAAATQFSGTTLYPLARGQQLREDYFSADPQVLTENLQPSERLMTITASVASSVAGNIRPGDSVDIIGVDETTALSNIVAANVPVVSVSPAASQIEQAASAQTGEAIDATPSELLPGTPIPGLYTIRIDASQVATLSGADALTTLYLAYRAPGSSDAAPASGVNIQELITNGIQSSNG